MNNKTITRGNESILLHGKGLFSKGEVTVSISKKENDTDIVFVLNNERIQAIADNVSNSTRNTVLSNGKENICLIEHFLATVSLLGINNLEVVTDSNELIFDDGSGIHWYKAFSKANLNYDVSEKYNLLNPLFIKDGDKEIAAIPHNGFKVSYLMDWNHPALGRLWASWQISDGVEKLVRARSFATEEENNFFCASDRLLTLEKNGFNKELYEPLEPLYHKIFDIIGDLRLSGINPVEINMHVIGFKNGHQLNVEMAKELRRIFQKV